ncbi:MAG: DUF6531 domain-containing protein [Gammaproteobacteria bacterium]|nr:DUF6531 domain-containing protein [Gammaproteobacteria bacterium]
MHPINGRTPGTVGMDPTTGDDAAQTPMTTGTMAQDPGPRDDALQELKTEVVLDISQLVLDLTGIIDPTPASDGTNALISLARGDFWGAAISAISIVPLVGDLAKTAKLPRYVQSVRKAVYIAKLDPQWASALRELFTNLNSVLDKVYKMSDVLPDAALRQLKQIKGEVDEFINPKLGGKYESKVASGGGTPQTPSQIHRKPETSPEPARPAETKDATEASSSNKDPGTTETKQCTPANPKCQGEPISMVTGEELLEQVDFVLPGPIPLVWQRTYRSSNSQNTGIGAGWMGPWRARLKIESDKVDYKDYQGRHISFTKPKVGDGCRNITEKLTLYRDSDQQYRIVDDSGQVFWFTGPKTVKRLQKLANNDSHAIQYHYSDSGRLIRMTDSSGRQLKLDYNITNHVKAVYLLDEKGEKQGAPLVQYSYSNDGDLIAVADGNGNKETFAYKNHIITRRTTRDGFSFYFEWDQYDNFGKCLHNWGDNGTYDYRFEYDIKNKITHSTDGRGNTLEFHYNAMGYITKEIDPEGGVKVFHYNDTGQVTETTDALGNATQTHYNKNGQVSKVVNSNGDETSIIYNLGGRPVALIDAQGNKWQRKYDSKGRLSATIDPNGATTQYKYDKRGNLIQVTDAGGRSRQYEWNKKHELIAQTDAAGNRTEYQYDARGQVSKVTDSQGKQTLYFYDGNGNITQVFNPDNSNIQLQYTPGGHLTHHIDALGRTTQYRYDGLSQPVERIDANGRRFMYEYDAERNLTALINENNDRYELHYDKNERLIKEVGFDGRVQEYSYNAAGHLLQHADGAHRITQFKRDNNGRLLQKQSSDQEVSRFQYDNLGRLSAAENHHSKLSFKYDAVGRLIEEWQNGDCIRHGYNDIGQKIETQLPGDERIQFQYNELGLYTQVNYNGETVTQVQRDQQGRAIVRESGELKSHFDYDPMGRLIKQSTQAKDHHPILERSYRYNKAGNLKFIDDFKHGVTKFHYDALDRLQAVQGLTQERFAFDPAGNILDFDQVAQAKAGGQSAGFVKGNRLQVFQDYRFEYDDVGNLISQKKGKKETRFHYNHQNQLTRVEKDGQEFNYCYDPFGRRVKKQDAFGETTFLWSGDVILAEKRNNLNITYLHEPNSYVPLAQVRDGQIYHYHTDHLGTPQLVTDGVGEVVWEARYKAYGSVVQYEVEAIENPIRFQGQYYDTETGLHYNRNRYYHPVIGRFTSVDPIGLLGGTNNYEYAPNPTGWVDPLGLSSKDCGTQGTATVNFHEGGHFSVEINSSSSQQKTHQVITSADRSTTQIVDADVRPPSKPIKSSATIDIPDAQSAIAKQKELMDQGNLGAYDKIDNSCVSHVCDVLDAGGLETPAPQGSAQSKHLFRILKGSSAK